VAGASKGGTITVQQVADFEHLDPARNYVNVQQLTAGLIYRTLTNYKEDGSGNLKLVGDLAENPGTDVNKDCKVWEYKLREGLKYEDGSTIKAGDVAYGIARSFAPSLNEGPHFVQQWLTNSQKYNDTYKGPYDGGAAVPPGVTVKDDRTISFTFAEPHCEMPYAAAMPNVSAVPQAQDTKDKYDLKPFSSGPYKVKSYTRDNSLVLERNTYWDANTDPIRNAYPDGFQFKFGLEAEQIANRLVADAGEDQTSLTWTDVPPSVLPKTTAPGVSERVAKGATQYVWYYAINNQRIKDINIRKALNYAIDKDAILKEIGGDAAGEPATTLLSPTVGGYKKYDVFNAPAKGDPAKSKELLGGKTVEIVLAHANTTLRTKQAEAARKSLELAGFKVTMKSIEATSYYDEVGRKNNPYDIYLHGWGSDWPSAGTVIPPLYDGSEITDEGNNNLSYFNDPGINAEIKRIKALPPGEAEAEWAKLDEKIMRDFVPEVPAYYDRTYVLRGSKVGGTFLSDAFGAYTLFPVFVKA